MFESFKKFNDGLGKIATISGLLLIPFFFASAAGAAVAAGATNGSILSSFWAPLMTDPVTGAVGLKAGLTKMFNGAVALFKSGGSVLGSAFTAAANGGGLGGVGTALSTSLSAPIIG